MNEDFMICPMNRDEEGYALTTPEIGSICIVVVVVVVVGAESSVLLWRNLCLLFYFKMICYHAPSFWCFEDFFIIKSTKVKKNLFNHISNRH